METWSLYLVRCGDGSLYTGIATDVARRFAEHQSGKGARYLRGRGPLELVYRHPVGNRSEALQLEHRVKRLSKQQKEHLVQRPTSLATVLPPPA